MKKLLFVILAVLSFAVVDAFAATPKRRAAAKSTATATVTIGEPIKQILAQNDTLIMTIGNVTPQIAGQVLQTSAFLAPGAEIAAQNAGYVLTAADKKALVASYNKLIDSFNKPLQKLGNSPAKVTKALTPIKTELAKRLNALYTLEGFYR